MAQNHNPQSDDWSPEENVVYQLLSQNVSLAAIRPIFASDDELLEAVLGMIQSGDVRLLTDYGASVPDIQLRELLIDRRAILQLGAFQLCLTRQGYDRAR